MKEFHCTNCILHGPAYHFGFIDNQGYAVCYRCWEAMNPFRRFIIIRKGRKEGWYKIAPMEPFENTFEYNSVTEFK